MGTADGYTKAHMKAVEDACIVAGAVDLSGHLQLTRHDGTSFDAGMVQGPQGLQGVAPTGAMIRWGGTTPPAGWFLCNGASLLRTDYPDLFAVIGTTYGSSDGSHFYLPDNRGWRGISASTGSVANVTWQKLGVSTDTANGYVSQSGRYYVYSAGDFTIVTPGEYNVFGQITFAADATGARYLIGIRKNGLEMARNDYTFGTRNDPASLTIFETVKFDAGDVLSVQYYQNSGAATTLAASPGHVVEFRPTAIGDIIKY